MLPVLSLLMCFSEEDAQYHTISSPHIQDHSGGPQHDENLTGAALTVPTSASNQPLPDIMLNSDLRSISGYSGVLTQWYFVMPRLQGIIVRLSCI